MIVLETDRLILRHFHLFDAEPMSGVFGDPQVMRFGNGVKSAEWVRDWLRKCLANYHAQWGFGLWAVVLKERSETIGYCGLSHFPDVGGKPEIEIGYRLARMYWGHGYATEAVIAVRDFGFHSLSLNRLIAIIDPQNTASIQVARKAMMRFEKEVMLAGYTHPDHVYAVARSDVGDGDHLPE